MNQQPLQFVDNLEALVGLTPWASGPPPYHGWWQTRFVPGSPQTFTFEQRRFWDGVAWSLYVVIGESDAETEACRLTPAMNTPDIEWRGLPVPHPNGYPYMLGPSPRALLATQIAQTTAPKPTRRVALLED